jgi:RND superfamily putative drug exporter
MLRRITSFSIRHRWSVVGLWVAVIASTFVAAPTLFDRLTADVGDITGTESQRGYALLADADPEGETIYAAVQGFPSLEEVRPQIEDAAAQIGQIQGVESAVTPWSTSDDGTADPRMVSRGRDAVAVQVQFAATPDAEDAIEQAEHILRSIDAPTVLVGGGPLLDDEMDDQAASDLARAELISVPVMIVLLLLVFGGFMAAGLPVVISLVAVASTLLMLMLFSLVADVSVYSINIVTMLGLGLAVDYALLVVTRFREERARATLVPDALMRTMERAGRTVAYSGLTVAASLAGLLVFPDAFLRSMGFAGMSVVALDMLAALTLLPVLLMTFGHRIPPSPIRRDTAGAFARLARFARSRPFILTGAITVLLLVAATPFLGARFSDPDERSLPATSQSRQLAELARSSFDSVASEDPIIAIGPAMDDASTNVLVAELSALDGVKRVSARAEAGDHAIIDVIPEPDGQGIPADDLVRHVRALAGPAGLAVTGDAAELVDYEDAIVSRIPWALAVIIVATFALLFAMTGSVVIPVKALVLNTLSLGASFGALVWVFQDGHLAGLIGTEALGSLNITTPVLVFAIAFGLSMDYEVFLLGRITEAWRQTGDTDKAVEIGVQRTGRVVTAAAVLMIAVYAAFVSGGFAPIKQVGLGLVLAVLVDATIVRMLMLPAVMSMMGKSNWWAPAPLRRWHDRHGMRHADDPASIVVSQATPTPEPSFRR